MNTRYFDIMREKMIALVLTFSIIQRCRKNLNNYRKRKYEISIGKK